jgi:alpha-beta hydrolase superfamily lysophospholipase
MPEVEFITTKHGHKLATRSWPVADPVASVLLVHGAAEHSGRYDHVAEHLNARGLSVSSYDTRGHGQSEGARLHVETWSDYLDDLSDRLADLGSDRPLVLYGHSTGGLVALDYVIQRIDPRPAALVVTNPLLASTAPRWKQTLAPVLARFAGTAKLPMGLRSEQLSRDPAVGEKYFADPLVLTRATAQWGAEVLLAIERVQEGSDRIDIPTLVKTSGQDTIVPPSSSLRLTESPSVTRILYPTLRHEVHNEPEGAEVVDAIADWILATVG